MGFARGRDSIDDLGILIPAQYFRRNAARTE
jgi:hypothetical protein